MIKTIHSVFMYGLGDRMVYTSMLEDLIGCKMTSEELIQELSRCDWLYRDNKPAPAIEDLMKVPEFRFSAGFIRRRQGLIVADVNAVPLKMVSLLSGGGIPLLLYEENERQWNFMTFENSKLVLRGAFATAKRMWAKPPARVKSWDVDIHPRAV